ncbi:hypothetical protein SAMN05421780_1022 [Flexibacter flexilis DSM 6793]|uniref:Nucleotidyl transferase AbiEii toxin, Type IV TA system n=1 Tax=Flexibacter flexilis DSM 6793 TaxID=927664 RepID=A0A1I1F0R7_9BACT|nr:hypothetical protein SAMN05421780_1022 [Flexibacter flexilis DSM 6793]
MIVGGTALAFHGHYRPTTLPDGQPSDKHDFDFWYNPTFENYFRLLQALEALGLNVARFRKEKVINPKKSFFTHEFDYFKIDFLPEVLGLERFYSSYPHRITTIVREIEIHILSKDDLIKSKEVTARKKDEEDIAQLRLHSPDQ